ncbi:MAG: hypothetical protein QG656_355, partial [Candidatus Hydrogenedentes bacterium]|nr:hypothetical protein [Candidatus Hydrogenedentota bacterium]
MKESSGDGKGFGARLFRSSKKKQYGVWPPPYTTLAEVLRARAQTQPDRLAYVHLKDGETESERITYGELEARARAIAARLQQKLDVGSRALLLYQPGIEYICAFLGCIYAGAAAVPAYPPDPNPKRLGRTLPRLLAIMRDADLSAILTTSDIASVAGPLLAQSPDCAAVERIATDTVPNSLAEQWKEPAITGGSVAFIQYTSGSTASPKGVMVSHTNLLYNFEDLDASNEHDPTSVMVTWLPMYHDMGLVFGILIPLYVGFPCYFMAPMDFLSKPVRWLQAITKYKATHTGAPNFALDYCVRRISPEERAALNLRNLEYIAEGSEPVRKSTLELVIAAYKPCGLRETAICPSYGMAESVLKMTVNPKPDPIVYCCVSSTELEQRRVKEVAPGAPDAYTLVGCGKGQLETRVEIVDPETLKRAAPDSVGEIWITSPGVCLGYWRRPEETRETFQAHLADTGEGPFLRTGDLGFFLRGELYITGRIKDLIILHGANYYPQDFEAVAEESHPALRPGCCAAFPLDAGGEEQVVIVQEVDEKRMAGVDPAEVAAAIRQAIR